MNNKRSWNLQSSQPGYQYNYDPTCIGQHIRLQDVSIPGARTKS